VALQLKLQAGIRQQDSGNFGHLLAGAGLQRVFVEIEEHVIDIHDQAAGAFLGLQDRVQLLHQALAHLAPFGLGLLALGVGLGGSLLGL
jgi:hypothetical protein